MDGLMDQIFSEDPYLAFQPPFSYTLPIQLLVSGITLTLLCVLAIHLIFTTQYHYPLAPLNYILQFLSILTVLISVFIRIIVILEHSGESGDTWPYSLDYVSVAIPPKSWSLGQDGAWFLLQGLNSGFANLAHIQFLTLLYPSRTEARLIVFVLGPLALASAFLVFTALSPSQTVLDLGDAIRNVFNSTLLLIFTIALLIWGLVVNRRRAWRTDGGTAIFGSAAIFLATVNTACNFVAVKEDGIDWLQHLLYCSILWQTWLGWWWWVGSGMGIGEVEDIMERAEKKKRRMAKKAARQRSIAKANRSGGATGENNNTSSGSNPLKMRRTASLGVVGEASAHAMAGFTSSVTGILRGRTGTLIRRRGSVHEGDGDRGESGSANRNDIELDDMPAPRPATPRPRRQGTAATAPSVTGSAPAAAGPTSAIANVTGPGDPSTPQVGFSASTYSGSQGRNHLSSNSETSSTSHTPSLNPPRTVGQFLSYPTTWLWVYLRQLRRAHEDAAKKQAVERAERRQKVFGEHPPGKINERPGARPRGADEAELGWGLGAFGIREHEEGERRLQQAGERLREERLLPDGSGPASDANADDRDRDRAPTPSPSPRPLAEEGDPGPSTLSARQRSVHLADDGDGFPNAAATAASSESRPGGPARGISTLSTQTAPGRIREEEWTDVDDEDEDSDSSDSGGVISRARRRRRNRNRNGDVDADGDGDDGAGDGAGRSWSWWGPLKKWRLADRSTF